MILDRLCRRLAALASILWLVSAWGGPAWAEGREARADEFLDMDLVQLMDVTITSLAKRPQKMGEAPAAIYVLTQEDLRRSGATSIAQALRLVPGLEVA